MPQQVPRPALLVALLLAPVLGGGLGAAAQWPGEAAAQVQAAVRAHRVQDADPAAGLARADRARDAAQAGRPAQPGAVPAPTALTAPAVTSAPAPSAGSAGTQAAPGPAAARPAPAPTSRPSSPAPAAPAPAAPPPSSPAAPPPAPAAASSAPSAEEYAARLVAGVNAERRARGVPELRLSSCAGGYAREHAQRMAREGRMHHQELGPVLSACGGSRVAENVGHGDVSPERMVELWMASAGHRATILDARLTSLGSGAARRDDGRWYACQVFLG